MIHSSTARQLTIEAQHPGLEEQITKAARNGHYSIVIDRLLTKSEKEELTKLGYEHSKRKIPGDYRLTDQVLHETVITW